MHSQYCQYIQTTLSQPNKYNTQYPKTGAAINYKSIAKDPTLQHLANSKPKLLAGNVPKQILSRRQIPSLAVGSDQFYGPRGAR